jgi:hypothetical protein
MTLMVINHLQYGEVHFILILIVNARFTEKYKIKIKIIYADRSIVCI